MKIYDISQELFTCVVYPGDASPAMRAVRRTERGDLYNLTEFSMCAHNGTHLDAPFHFLGDGKTVDRIPLEKTVGLCRVVAHDGPVTAADMARILSGAPDGEASRRLLFKGNTAITPEAATLLADADLDLVGVESQSVADEACTMAVHKSLLAREIVLLEGIRLSHVPEGVYLLSAAPLNLGGCDGAPCRAVLMEMCVQDGQERGVHHV